MTFEVCMCVGGRERCVYSGTGFGKGWDAFFWHESSFDFSTTHCNRHILASALQSVKRT